MQKLATAILRRVDTRIDDCIAELARSHGRLGDCISALDDSSLQTEEAKQFVERFLRLHRETADCALSLIGELSTLRSAVKQVIGDKDG